MTLGAVFSNREVARRYRYRAPYPDDVLTTLRRLTVAPRTILDVGAGTGALARRMVGFAERIDAIDPSAAMINEGRRLPGGGDRRLHWICGRAEDGPLSPPYGLITAGASLHWLDLDVAFARLREALSPGAVLAVADTEIVHGPYRPELEAVIREHSQLEHHTETPDFMEELNASGRFAIQGRHRTEPVPFEQSVDDYVEMLHSTSTLARVRLGDGASRFDADIRAVFARHGLDPLRYGVIGVVIWGRPT
ncbi:MAG: class I SAM-dependent methyltransferase [Chloroflexi bacterium]|nr:class I SAM-dependent methyltransferase [Chloroflexota bacterium]